MKNFFCLLACLLCVCTLFVGCAPTNQGDSETPACVVLTPNQTYVGRPLSEYMAYAKEQNIFDYTIDGTFVTSINGVANTTSYWMLYTNDAQNCDTWSTYEYEGTVYGVASYGATELIIASGCIYIWAYIAF